MTDPEVINLSARREVEQSIAAKFSGYREDRAGATPGQDRRADDDVDPLTQAIADAEAAGDWSLARRLKSARLASMTASINPPHDAA